MGNDNHAVSHKVCGVQERVGGRVVLMKVSVTVVSKFRSFSSHIYSPAHENFAVKFSVDGSVGRNKFIQHFLSFCWCLVALSVRHFKLTLDGPGNVNAI
jgi:hypothetical protein